MFAFPLYSLCVAHAKDLVDAKSFVEAASGLLLTWAAGAVIGPLIASALMAQFGGRGLFFFTIAVHLAIAVFVAVRIRKRTVIPEETRGSFVEAANAGATISAVDVGLTDTPITPPESVDQEEVVPKPDDEEPKPQPS